MSAAQARSRRRSGRVVPLWALAMLALGIGVAPTSGAPPVETVRVSFAPLQSNSALFIADRAGEFAAARIRVDWIPFAGSVQFTPVLAQGQLDVGAGTISAAFFNAVAAGLRLRVVADKGHVAGRGSVGSLVLRRDLSGTVKTAADLKGRRIAMNATGALGHYLVAQLLKRGGLAEDQVTLVTIPNASAVAVLQGGGIDLAVLPAPLDARAVELGVGVKLFDFADIIPGEPTAFLFMGPALLDANRALGVRFLSAYLRALRRYNEGPTARNIATVADFTKIEPEVIRKGGWIGIHADGAVDVNRLRRYQDWLYEIGLVGVRSPVSTLVEVGVLEQARQAAGVSSR